MLLEEFNDDQMVLWLKAEKALDITPPTETTVAREQDVSTSLQAPQPAPIDEESSATPAPENNVEQTEGILHILTEDWSWELVFIFLFHFDSLLWVRRATVLSHGRARCYPWD